MINTRDFLKETRVIPYLNSYNNILSKEQRDQIYLNKLARLTSCLIPCVYTWNPFNQLRCQGFRLKHRSKVVHVELFDYVARTVRGETRSFSTLRKNETSAQEYETRVRDSQSNRLIGKRLKFDREIGADITIAMTRYVTQRLSRKVNFRGKSL